MKYKVGIKNNTNLSTTVLILSSEYEQKAASNKVSTITEPRRLGYLATKLSPLEFKNVLLPTNATPEKSLTIKGTKITVIQKNIPASKALISRHKDDKPSPNCIPRKNSKLVKLSLFKRALIKFIILPILKAISFILAWFFHLSKNITYFAVAFALFVLLPTISLASDIPTLIKQVEEKHDIPAGLLSAIAFVESSHSPYALNVGGRAIIAKSKIEASRIARQYLSEGNNNIDLGLMQINYRFHSANFKNVDELLDLKKNVEYAAKLLKEGYDKHKSWQIAVRHYHSRNARYHVKYSRKVLICWLGA